MSESKNIVVIGAGLVGCLFALILKKEGHQVTIFEKRSDMRKDPLGAGRSINLILTRKGIEPLTNLGLIDKVLKITTPVHGRMMHNRAAELTYQPYGINDTEKNYSISRSELNKFLMNEVESQEIPIHFSNELKQIDFKTKTIQLENTKTHYDLLFGADGAGSVVRSEILQNFEKTHSKMIPLGTHYKELRMEAGPAGEYQMDQSALHIWPRGKHMLMGLPNQDGSFTMTLYMPKEWFEDFTNEDKVGKYFAEFYPDVLSLMANYKKDFFANKTGFLGSLEMNQWIFDESVCLMGDAAHAIVPFFGQGMNCAFTDAQFLWDQMQEQQGNWKLIFENYQAHQKPNGDAIRDMSLENFHEMCEHVADEKFIFRKKVENLIEKRFPHLYRSRYANVVYSLMPYHEAKEKALVAEKVIDQLCGNLQDISEVNIDLVEQLLS